MCIRLCLEKVYSVYVLYSALEEKVVYAGDNRGGPPTVPLVAIPCGTVAVRIPAQREPA